MCKILICRLVRLHVNKPSHVFALCGYHYHHPTSIVQKLNIFTPCFLFLNINELTTVFSFAVYAWKRELVNVFVWSFQVKGTTWQEAIWMIVDTTNQTEYLSKASCTNCCYIITSSACLYTTLFCVSFFVEHFSHLLPLHITCFKLNAAMTTTINPL